MPPAKTKGNTTWPTRQVSSRSPCKGSLGSGPSYWGALQCERTVSKKEASRILGEKLGFTPTVLSTAFKGLERVLREKSADACACVIDGVARISPYCKGSFESNRGPWTKGRNWIEVSATALGDFRNALAGVVAKNRTEGANPSIGSVIDVTTGQYDVLAPGHECSVTGRDLAPDTDREDEYMAFVGKDGVETRAEVSHAELTNVVGTVPATLEPGEYTLRIHTRSGLGEDFGVKAASRKVTVTE